MTNELGREMEGMKDRFMGALIGLAVGDAVGTTLEFVPPKKVVPIVDMVGGGPFHLKAGQWTDDTSMALCLADSLMACDGHNPKDQMERYWRWYEEGYRSSTGRCFDIGSTCKGSMYRFQMTGEPYAGSKNTKSAGNGSLMRLAPVPMYFLNEPLEKILDTAADSSRTTHGTVACMDACRYFSALLVGAMRGATKAELLAPYYSSEPNYWTTHPLESPEIREIAEGSFTRRNPPEIKGSGCFHFMIT